MKKMDPTSLVLSSVATKDIEFVIPPKAVSCGSGCRPGQNPISQKITVSNNPMLNNHQRVSSSTCLEAKKSECDNAATNKGWDFLATVFNASVTLKDAGNRKMRSKEAPALLITTAAASSGTFLDVPNVKTARSASLTVNSLGVPVNPKAPASPATSGQSSRRESVASGMINYLLPAPECSARRRSSLFSFSANPSPAVSGSTSPAPVAASSRPSICVEPEPGKFVQYGGINPSLYLNPEQYEDGDEAFPEHHLGRVYYSVYYDYINEELTVTVQRIRNLPKTSVEAGKTNKTYIKICLLPDDSSERKVTPRNEDTFADLNPEFFDSVVFPVAIVAVSCRTIRMVVFNIDVNRKHRALGQSLLHLKEVNLTHGKLHLNADLQKFINDNELPEVLLSVCFNSTLCRLTVNVVEGRNFKAQSSDAPPDSYIRLALMQQTKEKKAKKTEVIKRSNFPQFQQSLNFRLDEAELETCGIKVTAIVKQSFPERDRVMGTCVLGGVMIARGKGHEHWEEVKKNQKIHIQHWHNLVDDADSCPDKTKSGNNRGRSNSGVLALPRELEARKRRNSSIAPVRKH